MDLKGIFAEYGVPPDSPNNLTPGFDWPGTTAGGSQPSDQAGSGDAVQASAASAGGTSFLLRQRAPRSYFTTATQINTAQDMDKRSIVSIFANVSGPGTEVSHLCFQVADLN